MAVRTTKQIINEAPSWPATRIWERQHELLEQIVSSTDAREGSRAFLEKRAPIWQDR
jgi:enoyl-CoA hydratase